MTRLEKKIIAGFLAVLMCFSVVWTPVLNVNAAEPQNIETTEELKEAEPAEEEAAVQEPEVVEEETQKTEPVEEKEADLVAEVAEPAEEEPTPLAESVEIKVGEKYTSSVDETVEYFFTPEETGKYMVIGDDYVSPSVYENGTYVDPFLNEIYTLEAGKTYLIDIYGGWSYMLNWSLERVDEVELELGTSITTTSNQAVYYKFTAPESAKYEFLPNDMDITIHDEEDKLVDAKRYCIYEFEKDQTYYISINIYNTDEMTWNLEKIIENDIVIGQKYTMTEDSSVYYKFTADEAGWYKVCSSDYLGTTDYIYDENLQDVEKKADQFYELNAGETYYAKINADVGVNWSVEKVTKDTLIVGNRNTANSELQTYYTFAPGENAEYMFLYDEWIYFEVYDDSWNCVDKNTPITYALEKDKTYYVVLNAFDGEIGWSLEVAKNTPIETSQTIITNKNQSEYYTFTPEETGKYKFTSDNWLGIDIWVNNGEYWEDVPGKGDKNFELEQGQTYYMYMHVDEETAWSLKKVNETEIHVDEPVNTLKDEAVCYTFTPASSGKYQISSDNWMYAYVYDSEWNRLDQIADQFYELEKEQTYYILPEIDEDVTWSIGIVEEVVINAGDLVTTEKDQSVYYKIKTEESGKYKFNYNAPCYFEIYDENWNYESGSDIGTLEENKTYYIFVNSYSGKTDWSIVLMQAASVLEGVEVTTTQDQNLYYELIPTESGIYKFLYKLAFDSGMSLSITAEDGGSVETRGEYTYELEKGKKYYILLSVDNKLVWSINRLKEEFPEEDKTYSIDEKSYYTFIPGEAGLYQIVTDNRVYSEVYNKDWEWVDSLSGNLYNLEKDQPYHIFLSSSYDLSGENWSIEKPGKIEIQENQEVITEDGQAYYYKFKATKTGEYQVCFEFGGNCRVYKDNFEEVDSKIPAIYALEESKTYYVFMHAMQGGDVTWSIKSAGCENISVEQDVTTIKSEPKYYTITPEETGRYKIVSDQKIRYGLTDEDSYGIDDRSSSFELQKGVTYYIYDLNFKGESASWSIQKAKEIVIQEETEYTTAINEAVYYKFVPNKTGKYMNVSEGSGYVELYDEQWRELEREYPLNYFVLEEGKTYYVLPIIDNKNVIWSIKNVEEVDVQLDKEYTTTTQDTVLYHIKPEESGRYWVHSDGAWSVSFNEEVGVEYYFDAKCFELEAGKDYYFEVSPEKSGAVWSVEKEMISGGYAYRINKDDTIEIVEYQGNESEVTIPSELEGKKVTSIGAGAFCNKDSVKTVNIPEGIEKIGGDAFRDSGITEVIIPDSVTELCTSAFAYSDLKKVTLGSGLNKIATGTFRECESLEEVDFGKAQSVTEIEYDAFLYCTNLQNISIPASVKRMGQGAVSLTAWEEKQPEGVGYLDHVLLGYKGTMPENTELTVKEGTTVIADYAFSRKKNLGKVTLPDGVETIGKFAFYECPGVSSVTIPDSVTEIGTLSLGYLLGNQFDTLVNTDDISGYVKKVDGFTIYGASGSVAEKYADENGFKFVPTGGEVHKHTWDTGKITKPATCTEDGEKTYTCTECGETKTETVAALGHSSKSTVTKATLSANGKIVEKCSACGVTINSKVIYYPKTISLVDTSFVYDGKAKKPAVTVKDANGNTLDEKTDYTVSYSSGRTNVGTYKVTITFKGNYTGSTSLSFKIVPQATTTKLSLYGHDDVKVSWNKVPQADGYRVYYRKAGESSWTTKGYYTGTSVTLPNLADGTKYEVAVRPYKTVGTTKYYATYTPVSIYTLKATTTKLSLYGHDDVKVTWSDIYGESGYKVFYRKAGAKSWTTKGYYTGTSVTLPNLADGTKYEVAVRPYKTVGTTKYYAPYKTASIYTLKATTTKLSLYGYDDVKVTWSGIYGESGYKVFYRKAGATSWTTKGYYTGTSVTLPNLADGAKYEVAVRPYKIVNNTKIYAPYKTVSIYTLKRVYTPKISRYGSKIKVTWSNIAGESGYQISQSTTKTGTKIVSTYNTTSGTYRYVTATKGKYYYYKVRAYRTVGTKRIYGPWSTAVRYKR